MPNNDTLTVTGTIKRKANVRPRVAFSTMTVAQSSNMPSLENNDLEVVAFTDAIREDLAEFAPGDEASFAGYLKANSYSGTDEFVITAIETDDNNETTDGIDYVKDWWQAQSLQSLLDAGWVEARDCKEKDGNRYHVLSHPQAAPDEKDWITFDEFADGTVGTCPWMF